MANVIKPKRSSVAGNVPTTAQIGQYEIAMNTADKKIYTSDGTNILQIASGSLMGLSDILLTSKQNNDSLYYDSTSGLWKNLTPTAAKVALGLNNVNNTADASKDVLSATKLTTARTIALSGAVTGSASFDGSSNITINTTGGSQDIFAIYTYSATQGQTVFSGADLNSNVLFYTQGLILVTLNGVMLYGDYTATNGTSLTLTSAANAGDELNIYSFTSLNAANIYTISDGSYVRLNNIKTVNNQSIVGTGNIQINSVANATLSGATTGLSFGGTGLQDVNFSNVLTYPVDTSMALCLTNVDTGYVANFVPVVKQITSTDNSISITETSPGVWDLSAGTTGENWYVIQSSLAGTLSQSLPLPTSFTNSPIMMANLVVAAFSNGNNWMVNYPSFYSGYNGGWSSPQAPRYLDASGWNTTSSPLDAWDSPGPNAGISFAYTQYAPQSSNNYTSEIWGSYTYWNNGYGSTFSVFNPLTGVTKVLYLVLMIYGNAGTISTMHPSTVVDSAYDGFSNTTYVFCKVTNDADVSSILSGSSVITWSSPYSFYGHCWVEYS